MKKVNKYTFLVSEGKLNDLEIKDLVHVMEGNGTPVMIYKFLYTPPYEKNSNFIKKFQYRSAYKPFQDEAQKRKIAAINMTEWIGHEQEEKLELFIKFLHEYCSYFDFEYVLFAEKSNEYVVRDLYNKVSEFWGKGFLIEDKRREGKEVA